MPKTKVDCATCGGSYEDNPSGAKRHQSTGKHVVALGTKITATLESLPFPPKPTGLVVGGAPYADRELNLIGERYRAGEELKQIQKDLIKARHDLAYRESPKHVHQYGDRARQNLRNLIAELEQAAELATEGIEAMKAEELELKRVRYDANLAGDQALELYVSTLFSSDPSILVRGHGGGSFGVYGVTGKVATDTATGEEYPVKDGYEATVHGPERDTFAGESRVTPAYVAWSSSQMRTLAEAERKLRIQAVSIEVARLVNELYELES